MSNSNQRNSLQLKIATINNNNNNQQQQPTTINFIKHLIRFITTILLHLIYQLIHRFILRPKPIPISSSTKPINSIIIKPIIKPIHQLKPHLNRSSSVIRTYHHQHNNTNNLSSILITNNSELNPISLQLALDFATLGYHVFLQVTSHSQLNQLILKWQTLKSFLISSKLNLQLNIGTIIPLLYLSHDLNQRLEAISTIKAYINQNQIDMITLINLIDPYRIRKSYPIFYNSPISPTFSITRNHNLTTPSSSSSSVSPNLSHRPLAGINSSPSVSATSDQTNHIHSPSTPRSIPEIYNPQQLPLSISSENYLFDVFADLLLGPLSTTQDLLLLLKHHRGRVINIWDAHRYPQSALIEIMLNGFQKTNKVLKAELEPLQIPVSVIYKPSGNTHLNLKARTAQSTVTRDSRSLLSEASDPDLLHVFTKQTAETIRKEEIQITDFSDQKAIMSLFEMVRSVIETNYPCPTYPIAIRDVADLLTKVSGLDRAYCSLERLLGI